MKICTKCGESKSYSEFANCVRSKDGRQYKCRSCAALIAKEYGVRKREELSTRQREWRARNADALLEKRREQRRLNPEKERAPRRIHYAKNIDRERAYHKEYRRLNQDRLRAEQYAKYWENPEAWRAKMNARNRQNPIPTRTRAMERIAAKLRATPEWADPTRIEEYYFAADFLSMVTGIWHEVDHIVPLLSKMVCGLHVEKNLQVLTRTENRRKSNRHWPNMP